MTHRMFDFERGPKVEFEEYIETSIDVDVTNDMKTRTDGCIFLSPTDNFQGSCAAQVSTYP